jgi:aspartyl-tRNA(Asn)/glutamyl-tRNA(Gln) amidotransferase subunit A
LRIDPLLMPVRELSKYIRSGRVSPVELTEFCLRRLEKIGPAYNSVVTVTRGRALRQARRAEKEIEEGNYRGPLHGVPYGVKDLIATRGIPTTWGAAPFKDQVFDCDATVVRRLDQAGAVLCAKLAMIELAGGMGYRQPFASLTGPPKNPWNTGTWTGGSSSGSGAAVAAGLVPFALGSETWGSILSPSNSCGVAGLRPTYGRVSRHGAMALCWTLDKLGPLCQTADDCGIVLGAIAGPDAEDPTTADEPWTYKPKGARKRFRVGVLKGVADDAQEEVRRNFEEALGVVGRFASVEEFELPALPYEAITRTILNAEAASAFDEFVEAGLSHRLTAPEDHWGPYARTTLLATDYLRAMRLRGKMAKAVAEAMKPYDAVAAPTAKKAATPIDQEFRRVAPGATSDVMGAVGNGCGLPSIGVPDGFTGTGLPTGIQFMGHPYEENTVISVARAYQSLTDWHTRHPKT